MVNKLNSLEFKKRALISVHDKSGLVELADRLVKSGYKIIASGGTASSLRDSGIEVRSVESVTGSAEILGGRVKTLHPLIYGALLADLDQEEHLKDLEKNHIEPIELVICNLYPFAEAVASKASQDEIIENIDIGGPALLRAAAKNYKYVTVISRVSQYQLLIDNLEKGLSLQARRDLAGQAFALSQEYESAITNWFNPEGIELSYIEPKALRYGENPHQSASLYRKAGSSGVAGAELLQGRQMSYNNYLDADAALRAAKEHQGCTVAIIKHAIPCGIALGIDTAAAYKAALACDPVSAFGGVVGSNSIITASCAAAILGTFTEVVIAPGYEEKAREILASRANIRILRVDSFEFEPREIRAISGGLLIQDQDRINQSGDLAHNWQLVAGPGADSNQLADLEFAWRAIRSIRSNAVLIVKDLASIGIGAGQQNRLNSAKSAINNALDRAKGAVAASDGFLPFADGLAVLANAGISAVVQPGGSKRDEEVIKAASAAGVSMYFTGTRHFSHQ